jgi:sec-independent protein translocase protein TatB
MFGMGFMEIFLILVVAIIALGPEKLPSAAVDIAKFFKKLKGGVEDAKATLDNELNISGLKEEAENFKGQMNMDKLANIDIKDKVDDFVEDTVGDLGVDNLTDAFDTTSPKKVESSVEAKKTETKQEEKKA